jgi:hypothetical protein
LFRERIEHRISLNFPFSICFSKNQQNHQFLIGYALK